MHDFCFNNQLEHSGRDRAKAHYEPSGANRATQNFPTPGGKHPDGAGPARLLFKDPL